MKAWFKARLDPDLALAFSLGLLAALLALSWAVLSHVQTLSQH